MSHVDDGTLHALVDDALDATDRAAVEAHLASCGECARRFAEATAMARQTLSLLQMLDEAPAPRVRVERPQTGGATPSVGAVPRARRTVVTLRRIALAASVLVVAGVSYQMGRRTDAASPMATITAAAPEAAPMRRTPSVVEATADSVVLPQTPSVRAPVARGPRAESDAAPADVGGAASARPEAKALAAVPVQAPAPTAPAMQQRVAQVVEEAAAPPRAQDAATPQQRSRANDAVPAAEQAAGVGAQQAAAPAARRAEPTRASASAESPVALTASAVPSKARPLSGYAVVGHEAQTTQALSRYVSSSGTALTLLIAPGTESPKPARRVAAKSATEFVVSTRNGTSAVRWSANGLLYELTGPLAPDSLVKLATLLKQ